MLRKQAYMFQVSSQSFHKTKFSHLLIQPSIPIQILFHSSSSHTQNQACFSLILCSPMVLNFSIYTFLLSILFQPNLLLTMSNQQAPPTRPWFRLATMARPPPPPAAAPPTQAPPPPRPALIRPAFQQPTPTPQQPSPSPSPPTQRPTPSESPTTSPIPTTRAATQPTSPPKNLKPIEQAPPSLSPPKKSYPTPSPSSSPPLTPSSPPKNTSLGSSTMQPLSPLVLPSLKQKPYDDGLPEYKQKTIHVQETKEKPKTSATGFNGSHIGGVHAQNFTRKPETHKKHLDSEDAGKNIITIAGENKGAVMKITPFSDKKNGFGNIIRQKPTTSNNGETDSDAKNKNQNSNPLLKRSFLNSNVQGVNNSIVYNCSINHHDPGIHLTLSTKSDRGSGFQFKENKKE